MWLAPRTLLWPVYGVAFDRADLTGWTQSIYYALLADPAVYVPELVGAAILIWLVVVVMRHRKVGAFIRHGRV